MSKRKEQQGQNPQREKLKEMVRELGIEDAGDLYMALRDIFSDTLEEMLQSDWMSTWGMRDMNTEKSRPITAATGAVQKL